ncbi:MAG: hypothetical protein NC413_12935 [Muribaculum sp.]|nr:hypothetical protein [Muribaculum sp.]
MAKKSALCQLMKVRMNGVMNGITNSDGNIRRSSGNRTCIPTGWSRWNYQRKSDCYLA